MTTRLCAAESSCAAATTLTATCTLNTTRSHAVQASQQNDTEQTEPVARRVVLACKECRAR